MPYTTLRDHVKQICHKVGAGHSTVLTHAEELEIVVTCQVKLFPLPNNEHECDTHTEIPCTQN